MCNPVNTSFTPVLLYKIEVKGDQNYIGMFSWWSIAYQTEQRSSLYKASEIQTDINYAFDIFQKVIFCFVLYTEEEILRIFVMI